MTSVEKHEIQPSITSNSAKHSLKRARVLFENASPCSTLIPPSDKSIHRAMVSRKVQSYYPVVPSDGADIPKEPSTLTGKVLKDMREEVITALQSGNTIRAPPSKSSQTSSALIAASDTTAPRSSTGNGGGALTLHRETEIRPTDPQTLTTVPLPGQKLHSGTPSTSRILVSKTATARIPTPKWHAPWKLSSVLSSHLGWVRSVAFDPTNDMFATGGADRVIKIFDLAKACVGAEDALKITLTGHVSPVRGLAFSERHPYLFSAGEDKMVKCWDLETNQVVRHYHGHLSGVFSLKLHPTLDVLITGGRDAVARVWDMRTKQEIHVLTGHDNTVGAILTKATDPQVITGSYDTTIKLWDLAAGKCMTTLTHHKKSIRALAQPSFENTFISGAADTLKKWQGRNGKLIRSFTGHDSVVNALSVNDDGVLFSAADDGTMNFWDYHSGHCFQKTETIAQPGSLDAENGIFASEFDLTGTRLITCEADKTVKIWKQDEEATEMTDPIDLVGWRKKCLLEAKQRY